jgi:hypothetical protein
MYVDKCIVKYMYTYKCIDKKYDSECIMDKYMKMYVNEPVPSGRTPQKY